VGPSQRRLSLARAPPDILRAVRTPRIELLWWEGCPSTERALEQLREALADIGLPESTEVVLTEIRSDAQARTAGFTGSPTILLDDVDIADAGNSDPAQREDSDEPAALTCRVYRQRDGRILPTPDPDDLRDALGAAAAGPGPGVSAASGAPAGALADPDPRPGRGR